MNSNLTGLTAAVENSDFDGLLITAPHNRLYATGFNSSAGMLLVCKDRALFATDFRYFEAAQKIDGVKLCQADANNSYTDIICKFLKEYGIAKLGIEKDFMTCSEYEKFVGRLDCEFFSADNLIRNTRAIKSADEIKKIRRAQEISEIALGKTLEKIRIGTRECDIAAELVYQMYLNGAEKVSFDPIVVSGRNSSLPHGEPSDKKIAAGDFLTMDFGCKYNGYCSDMTRTVAVGYATSEMKELYNIVLQAQLSGISAVQTGRPCSEIDLAARQIIADAGYGEYFGHSLGHGVGVEIHEAPYLSSARSDLLPAGSVVTVEPGIYLPYKFGVRIEDMLYVKSDGAENLTSAPKELLIIG